METRTGGASVSGRSHSLWKTQPRASSGAFFAALARPRNAFECRAWRAVLVLPEGERPHPQCFPTGGLTRFEAIRMVLSRLAGSLAPKTHQQLSSLPPRIGLHPTRDRLRPRLLATSRVSV